MKEKEVRKLLKKNGISWQTFSDWMFGQTVGIDEDTEEILYYKWDVDRFIQYEKFKTPTYFD